MTLRNKIFSIVGLLVAVSVFLWSFSFVAFRYYHQHVQSMQDAASVSILGERINGLVLSVVADSRGLYMSTTHEEIEKYSTSLLDSLVHLEKTTEEWKKKFEVLPDPLQQLNSKILEFVGFRKELVRLARTHGTEAARSFGDNENNRNNRKKLNALIQDFSLENSDKIRAIALEMQEYYNQQIFLSLVLLVSSLAVCVGITMVLVAKGLTVPIHRITEAMQKISEGYLNTEIPYQENWIFFKQRQTSKPSMPGIMTSSNIRSIGCSSAILRASWPFLAVTTV